MTDSLYRELQLGETAASRISVNLESEFSSFINLKDELFKGIALDIAVVSGISGDWKTSLIFTKKLLDLNDARPEVKLWNIRTLLELENYADVLPLVARQRWDSQILIHIDYFMALTYEGLNMKQQARQKLQSVARRNASYRDVAQRLLNY